MHPGEQLKLELARRGWTQVELAEIIGRNPKVIWGLVNGTLSITPRTAHELAAAFGQAAEYWFDLQSKYYLAQFQKEEGDEINRRAKLFKKVPVREMIKRGWIEGTKNIDELERRVLDFFHLRSLEDEPAVLPHSARKSTSYEETTPSQLAWIFRARQLAESVQVQNFTETRFEEALERLRLLMHSPQETRHVASNLANGGVRLVVVEPLAGTKIDGACFWLNRKAPIVALSMRYDRIDYFWYTLMHELGHVRAGDGRGEEPWALDCGFGEDEPEEKPTKELAADVFASSFMVDREELDDFIIRVAPLYSPTRILGFAKRINVHPGIVVGQLQHLGEISYAHYRSTLTKVRNIVKDSALSDGWGFAP